MTSSTNTWKIGNDARLNDLLTISLLLGYIITLI